MINLLNKFFFQSKEQNSKNLSFFKLKNESSINKIFKAIDEFSDLSEIRYVGGCVRKILNDETVDDIDLAVNLNPTQVADILKKNNIKFYETGIKHGTITAIINQKKFEITSLRKDLETDGRHAKVEFSFDWREDANRRDFTINSIYSDIHGNLYDPFNGREDLKNGIVEFIGEQEKRIQEDYLRILRYVRFFLNYSKEKHNENTIKAIKKNLDGLSKVSSERLLDEFKKLSNSNSILKLNKDQFCIEIIQLVFPQFKNFNILNNLTNKDINNFDFIILISLLIIDSTDNTDYFLYKFNLSKYNKKRILFIKNFYLQPVNKKTFSKENLFKILYLDGKQSLLDLLTYRAFSLKKDRKKLFGLIDFFKDKNPPVIPIKASFLIEEYNIKEGKELGSKLKKIEEKWINNNFKISNEEIKKLVLN